MTTLPIAEIAEGTAVDHPANSSVRPRLTDTPATPAHPERRRAMLVAAESVMALLKPLRRVFAGWTG
jgi:hypothetical protein